LYLQGGELDSARPGGSSERGKESERRGDRGDLIEKVFMAFNSREVTGGVIPATVFRFQGEGREVRDDPGDGVPPVSSEEKEKEKEREPEWVRGAAG
jgi:hypothetical protein